MRFSYSICLSACLLAFCTFLGCGQGTKEEPNATIKNAPKVHQSIFGDELTQNIISNRMEQNLSLLETKLSGLKRHNFTSAGIDIYMPESMSLAERFTGFFNKEKGVSIVVLMNPFSMKKTTAQIVSQSVHTPQVSIVYTSEIEIDGREGKFYVTKEKVNNATVCKYIMAFGDDDFSWIVTANLTAALEDEFGESLMLAMKSIKVSDAPRSPAGSDVGFTIEPNKLVLTDGFIDKLVYTLGGEFPVDRTDEPIFQVGRPVIDFDVQDRLSVAKIAMSPSPAFAIDVVSSQKEVEIDGLQGYEFVAIGLDMVSKVPLRIYSVVLFDGRDGYVMHGWVSSDRTEDFISEFRSLAKSFKRK